MFNIYPSLMAADQQNLEKTIQLLEPHCQGFHLDVMDNIFVPNVTWTADEVNEIAFKIDKLVWVHLMVDNPVAFYRALLLKKGSLVSFHIESGIDIFGAIKTIREKKHRFSLAISPKTPIMRIVPFLNVVDHILLMSVEPGLSGQPFLKESLDRISQLVAYRDKHNFTFGLGVDGGVNKNNINQLGLQGVDDVVVGSGIFDDTDFVGALKKLYI